MPGDSREDAPNPGLISVGDAVKRIVRNEMDRRRIGAWNWIAAFFYNPAQREEALGSWEGFWGSLIFLEQMNLVSRQLGDVPEKPDADTIARDLDEAKRLGRLPVFSETALLQPEALTIRDDPVRRPLLERYGELGGGFSFQYPELADTISAEASFFQALIAQGATDREQARFFFAHLRPLGYASAKALETATANEGVRRIAFGIRLALMSDESLFKNGFTGRPACTTSLN